MFFLFRVVEHGIATGVLLPGRQGSRPPGSDLCWAWSTVGYRYPDMHRPGRRAGQGFATRQPDWVPTSSSSGTSAPCLYGARRQTGTFRSQVRKAHHVSVRLDWERSGWLPLAGEAGGPVSEAYFWSTHGLAGLGCRDSALLTGPPAWHRRISPGLCTVQNTTWRMSFG